MSYLRYLCLSTHVGIQHILHCVFCFVFRSFVYPMLPISLTFIVCMSKKISFQALDHLTGNIKVDLIHCFNLAN
jgi:hypothetical protein